MRRRSSVEDNHWFDILNDDLDRRGKNFGGPPASSNVRAAVSRTPEPPSTRVTRVSIGPQRISTGDEKFPTETT